MTEYKNITIVNEHDEVIGGMPLLDAMAQDCFRRVIRVFIMNEAGQLLIQERGEKVFTPCRLDFSVAGHVDEGESYEEAALRELQEELGMADAALTEVATSFPSGKYFGGVFKLIVPNERDFAVNHDEVASVRWYHPDEIDQLIERSPTEFTPEFVELWQHLRDKILQT
jgi:16S rRNA (adenine1518-N6/adenine1519-N6)-dimethyltransferase